MVYFDNAATTKPTVAVLNTMTNIYLHSWENPSALYTGAQNAYHLLEHYRGRIAYMLHCEDGEVYFTSGGTESDNWAIKSLAALGERSGKKHAVSTSIEHHAVLNALYDLELSGWEITYLTPSKLGVVDPVALEKALRPDTAFVSVMYANNETGAVQPIREIGAICREHNIPFHVDAVQAVGHIPVDMESDNIDLLSLSAHKFKGPLGVGALAVKGNIQLPPFIVGGGQERNMRAGTENLPGVAGMERALSDCCSNLQETIHEVANLRRELIAQIEKRIPGAHWVQTSSNCLPGIASFVIEGVESMPLILRLSREGVCASAGSACNSGSLDPSHVLLAMGYDRELAHGAVRFSLSEYNTLDEVLYTVDKLSSIVSDLREMMC